MNNALRRLVGTVVIVVAAVGPAVAERFVLQAPAWGAAQAAAVAAAGGKVVISHGETGVAVVDAPDAAFLDRIRRSPAIQFADRDIHLLSEPTPVVDPADIHLLDIHLLDIHLLDIHLLDIHLLDIYLLSPWPGAPLPDPLGNPLYPLQWAPRSVNAPAAWAAGYTGRGVRVAVLDGGLYADHEDLAGAVDRAASRSCTEGTFDSDVGTFWHGTHVAGIVGARNDGKGVIGIAPDATLIGVKVLHGGSGSFGSLICGILHAATTARADVINMSLGAVVPKSDPGAGRLIAALNKAIDFAARNGALVVSAAGNDELDADHSGNLALVPAQSGSGMAVAATGPLGWAMGNRDFSRFASYSNSGTSLVSVAAPGGDAALPGDALCTVGGITRPCWVFDLVLSTARGDVAAGGYRWAAGTSMAAPVVAGVAALAKQRFPGASPAQLRALLESSAVDTGKQGRDPLYGRGFIDALRAVAP